jgi:hypothetical protein
MKKIKCCEYSPRGLYYKTFTAVFAGVFAYAIHFHPSLIFARKAGAYQRLHSHGRLLSLPENIGTVNGISNTLAYCDTATKTAIKTWIVQAPGAVFTTLIILRNLRMCSIS